jgi:hypothetical protein
MKTAFIFSFVALPLALIGLVTRRVGFAVLPTLAASVIGEMLAVLLLVSYHNWKTAQILSGRMPGAVAYIGNVDPKRRAVALLLLCGVGAVIGLLVLAGHWVYSRVQSA